MELDEWSLGGARIEPTGEGFNSRSWHVWAGGKRYVAKRVGGERQAFEVGLRAAMTGRYFAWRISEGDTTGAVTSAARGAEWNRAGLEQARRQWESLRA